MHTVEEIKPQPEKETSSQRKFAIGAIIALWVSLILAFVIIGLPKTKVNESAKQKAVVDPTSSITHNQTQISQDSNTHLQKENTNLVQLNSKSNAPNDLVFYSKKAFLKYFINEYSEADLNKSLAVAKYNNKEQSETKEKKLILKVVRKKPIADKKEFSNDFEIKAVPNK